MQSQLSFQFSEMVMGSSSRLSGSSTAYKSRLLLLSTD